MRKIKYKRATTHNIRQLGFSGLRAFGFQANYLLDGYRRAPKTHPFHIVNRYLALKIQI